MNISGILHNPLGKDKMEIISAPNAVRKITWAIYVLLGASLVFPFLAFGAIVLNIYASDDSLASPIDASHFRWQAKTFWWSLVYTIVGIALFITVIGAPIAFIVWVVAFFWGAYRVIRGAMKLSENALPKPGY